MRAGLALLVLLLVWTVASVFLGPVLLPSPLAVILKAASLLASGELEHHALTSLWRMVIGFGVAVTLGVPLGLVMGRSRLISDALLVPVELLRPIAGIAWIPVGLYVFGISEALPIFIIAYAAFFPILLNTIEGVEAAGRRLTAAGRVLGARGFTLYWRVILPAAMPKVLNGIRIALGIAWMAIVAAEFVGAPSGLGYMIEWYRTMLSTESIIAALIVVGLLGGTMDFLARAALRRFAPYE
jgi:ABC-type nitrate/sulfonate/bicarbonate transport system permease component